LVQNALKLTYEHLQVQKFFLGSLSLAMKGIKKGEGRGGEGRGGEGEGKGRGGEGRGREGRGGERREGREGKGREVPPTFYPWLRPCGPVPLADLGISG
jgi:hypothetical protein